MAFLLSPPLSPLFSCTNDVPVIATNGLGMIVEDGTDHSNETRKKRRRQQDSKVVHSKRETRKYVSKHFLQMKPTTKPPRHKKARKAIKTRDVDAEPGIHCQNHEIVGDAEQVENRVQHTRHTQLHPRIFYGLNVDELSSDSDLTDVPSDIGPDPFDTSHSSFGRDKKTSKVKQRLRNSTTSPYFPNTVHRHRQHFLTTLPFPPLDCPRFGLMQERLAHDPFRLLLATIFLNKTPGERAMPIFFELMSQYPSPLALSNAKVESVTEIIRTLGFQNQRAQKCVAMARAWVVLPPVMGKRYRKLNYPCKGDGRDIKEGEAVDDDDERVAWEISHLPGLGPYSHDSWRMFCRDKMRGLADDWLGKEAKDGFEPEWKRVVPTDKELRAWMTWMWLKEGWIWNKETGSLSRAGEGLLQLAKGGGVVHETVISNHLVVKGLDQETTLDKMNVETPAGNFMPK